MVVEALVARGDFGRAVEGAGIDHLNGMKRKTLTAGIWVRVFREKSVPTLPASSQQDATQCDHGQREAGGLGDGFKGNTGDSLGAASYNIYIKCITVRSDDVEKDIFGRVCCQSKATVGRCAAASASGLIDRNGANSVASTLTNKHCKNKLRVLSHAKT